LEGVLVWRGSQFDICLRFFLVVGDLGWGGYFWKNNCFPADGAFSSGKMYSDELHLEEK